MRIRLPSAALAFALFVALGPVAQAQPVPGTDMAGIVQRFGPAVVNVSVSGTRRVSASDDDPADDAGDELLALSVKLRDQVGAVVHGDARPRVQHRLDMPVVALVVLTLLRVDGDPVLAGEGGRHIVLGR